MKKKKQTNIQRKIEQKINKYEYEEKLNENDHERSPLMTWGSP